MSQLVNGTLSMTGACNTGECPATMEGSVRCVLDLDLVYGLIILHMTYLLFLQCKVQLCDRLESSSYGAAQCHWYTNGCQGASNPNCYPYGLWSGSPSETNYYHNRELQNGSYNVTYSKHAGNAFSVRCVLDLNILFVKFFIKTIQIELQLCDREASSTYGAAQCQPFYGGCQGAAIGLNWNGNCYPITIWSSSPAQSIGYHYAYDFSGGSFYNPHGTSGHFVTLSLSVRCVLDLR